MTHRSSCHGTALVLLAALAMTLTACQSAKNPQFADRTSFASPKAAVSALATAAREGNTDRLLVLFGPEGRDILSSGDPVADRQNLEVFVIALDQKLEINKIDSATRELIIGNEEWPFPIPLVKDSAGWQFDTAAGKVEVLARRIGRNELAAISVCHSYVAAQRLYASEGRDGKPAGLYAQKVRSTPGKHDGLYWKSNAPDEDSSPLSEFAAAAQAEGYATGGSPKPQPFHGYYFRILTQQGDAAPGGAKNYIVDGDMSGGFALIAHPVEYGNSGIMSFIVNQDGVVHEADLGPQTPTVAPTIQAYNPDQNWRIVE